MARDCYVLKDSSAILGGIGDQATVVWQLWLAVFALYAGAGSPLHTMPVNLDAKINRKELIEDPHYLASAFPPA